MKSRWLTALLVVALFGFGLVLWQQQQVIDRLTAGAATGGGPTPAAPARTPALSNVDFSVALEDAPSRGNPSAAVVLLEYSDFQCPYCGRYVRETLPRLDDEYLKTGKIRYVFRQFPLPSLHPNATGAAIVSACAVERGKFWELHDLFFANQQGLDRAALMGMAASVGLVDAAFKACVEASTPAAMIQRTREEAVRAGFTGTPGYLVGRVGADGIVRATRRLYGAVPYSLFQSAINDVLAGK